MGILAVCVGRAAGNTVFNNFGVLTKLKFPDRTWSKNPPESKLPLSFISISLNVVKTADRAKTQCSRFLRSCAKIEHQKSLVCSILPSSLAVLRSE
ncbi:MAG: hypothetical protein M2R45_01959 [Verrucomicrobia subdivision 3 bacterium]|nr:hypothetical protein [Limisphaerales bacterium]MCS1416174.1 hypothetical protein [Limisphaerales bacterium]